MVLFFFFKQKTAYEMLRSLVGSEMCIRDSADEDPTEEVVVWCRGKDVKISTRRGHEGYQRLTLSLIHI